ncbi:MAG: hypothetical protein ACR2O3_11510 [Rhizobiaceae bacterium]
MRKYLLPVITIPLWLVANTGLAADAISEDTSITERMAPEWTVSIDPLYSWLFGLKGDLRVFGGPGVAVDVTTGDILDNLSEFLDAIDGLYLGSGEFRNHQFGLQWDVVFISQGASAAFGNRIQGAADVGFRMSMTTLAANYRVHETTNSHVDLIGGLRITDVQADISAVVGPIVATRSGGDTWVDPVIGVKGRYDLNENWYLKGSALYGGFGVSSDSLYDIAGFVGYEWNNGIELYTGWRIADTDYENGPFKWDVRLSGPMTGLTFKF